MGSELQVLRELVDSGVLTPSQLRIVQAAMNDPSKLDEALKVLSDLGADQLAGGPLNIQDFYREGTKAFRLRWPLGIALPMDFSQLDPKTQFFVLFQEWTRRELEGMSALDAGYLEEAEQTFDECLKRAQQLDVGELAARSYEGLARVADKLGKRDAARNFSRKAVKARAE